MLGRIHISIGCTHVSYPNTRCLHLLVFLLLVQLSAARVKLQYFPSQVSFMAFPPALNSCHQDQGWRRWQEGEVCALCAAVHSKVFYILGNEIEETLVAQSHSKEPTQRDFLSLVTSLAGSLILWRLKIVISFVCDKGWIYGIPKIFHQQWMGFVLTMNWSMLSAGQLRGGGSSPGPGTGGWVFILKKLLIMISHDST